MTQKEIKSPYKSIVFDEESGGDKGRLKIDTFIEDVYDIDSLINETFHQSMMKLLLQ